MGCVWGAWGCFLSFQGCFGGVGGCIRALRVIWECFLLNSHQYTWCTYKSTDIFQKTWRSQMSQISKCPKVTVVLTYWEASGDVSGILGFDDFPIIYHAQRDQWKNYFLSFEVSITFERMFKAIDCFTLHPSILVFLLWCESCFQLDGYPDPDTLSSQP